MELHLVDGPTGQLAWREAALRNLTTGAIGPETAGRIAALLSGAGASKAPERGEGGDADAVSRLDRALDRWEARQAPASGPAAKPG